VRVLVLGASGGIGRWLVRIAAERGHVVTALVRDSAEVDVPEAVRLRRGDVTDPAVLDVVLPGQDVVLSALGLRRAGRGPWAPLRSPRDLVAHAMRGLVAAMGRHGVRRTIVVSAAGVGDSLACCSLPVRRLVAAGNVGVAYRDLLAAEAVLAASDRDWLAVRPVTLVDGPPQRPARPVARYGLASTVRRAEVATWMLDAAARPTPFVERRVMLGR
jgi:putative NADH-flavin reductase